MAGKNRREHADENAESKGHGKSADGTSSKVEQERGTYNYGQVRVEYSAESSGETCTDRRP